MNSPSDAMRSGTMAIDSVSAPVSENVRGCLSFSNATRSDAPSPQPPILPSPNLEPRQLTAIDLLLTGHTDLAIAAQLHINPRTLYRWKRLNAAFRDQLARRREELYGQSADRLSHTVERAITALRRQVKHADPLTSHRAAATILRISRIGNRLCPPSDSW